MILLNVFVFLLNIMKKVLGYIAAVILVCCIPLSCALLVSHDLAQTKKMKAERQKAEKEKVYHIKVHYHGKDYVEL